MSLTPAAPTTAPAPRARLLRHALWAAGAVGIAAWGLRHAARGIDFVTFHDVGALALGRGNVYAPTPTSGMVVFYAPHFSLLMMPFAALPRPLAGLLWFAFEVVALAWVVRIAFEEIRATAGDDGRRWRAPAYLALALLLAANAIVVETKLGQVNLFIFVLTLLAVREARAGRTWRAAGLFSVALVKVTPWVFIPWFAFRRQWRLLGALCATGAAWLAALAAWFGPARVPELFLTWFETSRARKLDLAEVAYFENQSIQGVLARLTRAFPALGERILGVPAHALAWAAATLLLLGVALASARRDRFRAALPPAELAFICLVMFLCSPDSRWAHQVQLLAPLTFLGALAARVELLARAGDAVRPLARWRLAVGAVVVAGLLAQVVLTTDVIGKQNAVIVRLWASHFLFAVALTALVGAFLLVGRREPSAPTSGDDDPLGIRAALPRAGDRVMAGRVSGAAPT